MEILKIIGVALITVFTSALLKSSKPELSFAVTVTGIIVISLFIIDALEGTLTSFSSLAQITGAPNGLLKLLIKIVGVGYITEFGAGIITDFGSPSVADKVVLAGKLTIIILSIPILESLLKLIGGFLQLV
jgi:stage III sporulation protein AD